MRQVTRTGLISVAAASGWLALSGGAAYADSDADGAAGNSPGVVSGNVVQAPIHVPINVCGNTVNVVGALNPAVGNQCQNGGGGGKGGGASAQAQTDGSPGLLSGNSVQAPVEVPVNACGNSVDAVGVGNEVEGNVCVNDGSGGQRPQEQPEPNEPGDPGQPREAAGQEPVAEPQEAPAEAPGSAVDPQLGDDPELAATGGGPGMTTVLPVGAGLLTGVGGLLLYRRARLARQG